MAASLSELEATLSATGGNALGESLHAPVNILLVDDQPGRLLTYRTILEPLGERLVEASSGEQALARLMVDDFAVILLDVNMPGMDGFEVLQALKDDPRLHLIPVVMLSTSGAQDDVQAAYTLYASSYIVKAQQFTAFLEQMDGFLRYWQRVNLTVQR